MGSHHISYGLDVFLPSLHLPYPLFSCSWSRQPFTPTNHPSARPPGLHSPESSLRPNDLKLHLPLELRGPRSEIQLLKVQWLQLSFLTFGKGGVGYQRLPCQAVTWLKPPTAASAGLTSPSILAPEEALFLCTLSKISRLICSMIHYLFSWLSVAFSEDLSKAQIQNDLWLFLQRSFHIHEISQGKPLVAGFRSF